MCIRDSAQYRELEVFSQFASDLDKATQDALNNGLKVTKALVQPQYTPYSVENQVILLCVATNKVLMDIPVEKVRKFNEEFLDFVNAKYPHCLLYTSPSPRDRQKSRMPSSA